MTENILKNLPRIQLISFYAIEKTNAKIYIYLLFTIAMVEISDNVNIEDNYWGWRDT